MAFGNNSQNQKILSHLRQYGTITPMQALFEYGTMRLASRVTDLKKSGVDVRKVMVLSPSGRRYARYHIHTEPTNVAA